VGMSQSKATAELEEGGFEVSVAEEASSDVDQGLVIRQSPLANQRVMEGSTVTIVVSTGPARVSVPNVRGMTEAEAKEALTDEGLSYTVTYQDAPNPSDVGKVIDQIPVPGTEVDTGYNVRIFVGRAP
jgi:beta-lactam-binding protein with PASTA domain